MTDDPYAGILSQLNEHKAILFLGSGSTVDCRRAIDGLPGLTARGLTIEILNNLDTATASSIPPDRFPTLMEAAEYFQSNHPGGRSRLDKLVQERLRGLTPTLGHYLATSFPWSAVVTTNYNTVAEDAWKEAANHGYAANEALVIRTDGEIALFAGQTSKIRLYKPHGCVDLQGDPKYRMVLTSQDYAESADIRHGMYEAIRSLARLNTTVFVGYSMGDYTFRNMYYKLLLELGVWSNESFATQPTDSPVLFRWKSKAMAQLHTTLVNTSFDVLMLRLVKARGWVHSKLRDMIVGTWSEVALRNSAYLSGLQLDDFRSLPDQMASATPSP